MGRADPQSESTRGRPDSAPKASAETSPRCHPRGQRGRVHRPDPGRRGEVLVTRAAVRRFGPLLAVAGRRPGSNVLVQRRKRRAAVGKSSARDVHAGARGDSRGLLGGAAVQGGFLRQSRPPDDRRAAAGGSVQEGARHDPGGREEPGGQAQAVAGGRDAPPIRARVESRPACEPVGHRSHTRELDCQGRVLARRALRKAGFHLPHFAAG